MKDKNIPEYWKGEAPIPPLGELDYTNLKELLLRTFQMIQPSATLHNISVSEKDHLDGSKDLVVIVGPTLRQYLPWGADSGLRRVLANEYYNLLGVNAPYVSSGWAKTEDGTDISYDELYN